VIIDANLSYERSTSENAETALKTLQKRNNCNTREYLSFLKVTSSHAHDKAKVLILRTWPEKEKCWTLILYSILLHMQGVRLAKIQPRVDTFLITHRQTDRALQGLVTNVHKE